jgi:hypothetical protein
LKQPRKSRPDAAGVLSGHGEALSQDDIACQKNLAGSQIRLLMNLKLGGMKETHLHCVFVDFNSTSSLPPSFGIVPIDYSNHDLMIVCPLEWSF